MDLKFVLIIEANNQRRFQWEDILRDHGFPVLSATDIKQASLIIRNFPVQPSIIIHNHQVELPPELDLLLKLNSCELNNDNLIAKVRSLK